MTDMLIAMKKRTSYENFVAQCPSCGVESIFNRASDLHTFEPIAGRDVVCLNVACCKPFRIVGDSINNPHEMLIYDCYELIERKHYMNCILSLAQAYEVFFSLFFRVELLYKPCAADPNHDLVEMNRLAEEFQKKIKGHTFDPMRALFLHHMVIGRSPKNLVESAAMIAALPARPRDAQTPKNAAIEILSDAKLVPLLMKLKATSINTLRNRIVHKHAYRPTGDEAESALKETENILFSLQGRLNLQDDINCYMVPY
ncbi:MAG TPA: hypothetical protein VKS24_19225 [Bradyrhizobium sp.]|nr:hypothetical protein [Bradyrhizobium sp.]